MGRIKQEVTIKKKAIQKNKKKSKYTLSTKKTANQSYKDGVSTTKYAYTKKITVNGKPRYYYA